MFLSISKALNIESEERSLVFLLLTQSVFLGIFAGSLDVGANSLFLEDYSADLMPRAFMVSGAVGILFTSLYTFFQKRMAFKTFTILNLLIAVIITALLRIGYAVSDDPRVSFALLVMMGPLIIISLLGFWGTAGRYFTLREGKRLFGVIDTGSIIGMILAFYAVPVLVRFNFRVYDTLLIGLVSLVVALVFQIIVLGRHSIPQKAESNENQEKRKRTGLFSLFKKRYTSLMAFFVVMSVITAFFVHYSFMWTTEANYDDNRELTGFIGAFFGTMMIFTVIIKSTVYGWLMKNYGLRVALLISPVLLLILTVTATLVGWSKGLDPEVGGFVFFFLIISLSKLFNKSLKDAIESPAMKILYQSLDAGERFDVQARIDGVINEMTAFSAGLLMAGLLLLKNATVLYFTVILIGVLVLWIILGLALHRNYRKTLKDSLASARSSEQENENESRVILPVRLKSEFLGDLIKLDPLFFQTLGGADLYELIQKAVPETRKAILNFMVDDLHYSTTDLPADLEPILKEPDQLELASQFADREKMTGKSLDAAFRSGKKNQVIAALIQTQRDNDTAQVPHLIALLRDKDILLRKAAITMAGKMKIKELGSYLVDYIGHPELYVTAWTSLVTMGESIIDNLENAFHKTGVSVLVQLRLVRAMAVIGGEKARRFLYAKIDYHQRDIREAAIEGLYAVNFTPDEKESQHLQSVIFQLVQEGAENMVAEYVIRETKSSHILVNALSDEKKRIDYLLFILLGITFDRSAIGHVKESFMDVENEDTGFALELLNLIVDEQVFEYLEPYLDLLPVPEKVRRMQNTMPIGIQSYDELIISLLNRDGMYTGNYTRLAALQVILAEEELEAGWYLAAQVYHSDSVIGSGAAKILAEKDPAYFENILRRNSNNYGGFAEKEKLLDPKDNFNVLSNVEALIDWPLFRELSREAVYRLVLRMETGEDFDFTESGMVYLVRSIADSNSLLQHGTIIKAGDHPAFLEQIQYIASQPGFEVFRIREAAMRELLFDLKTLRNAFRELF